MPYGLSLNDHPHERYWRCECGETQVTYPFEPYCSTCTGEIKTATKTESKAYVFVYLDGDAGMGVPIFATADCHVEYTNRYSFPFSMIYNYPAFASYSSVVRSYADISPIYPSLNCISGRSVKYYTSSGSNIATQSMSWNPNNDAIPSNLGGYYSLNTEPSYTVSGATFAMPTSGMSYNLEVTTNFS